MAKFIPYEKLSKKEKRKIDQARRQTWGELNPVTRKPANSKAYNRNKARNWKRDDQRTNSGSYFIICGSSLPRRKADPVLPSEICPALSGCTLPWEALEDIRCV